MNYTAEIIASLVTGAAYCGLFIGVEVWSRRRSPDVELTRKVVHCGAGLIALAFPSIFGSPWTVSLLALFFAALLIVTRRSGHLRSVQGVERITIGEIVYPLAIASIFFLSSIAGGAPVYRMSLLVLAVADAAAGIVGKRYGRHIIFRAGGERKSLEGSASFYAASFLIITIGLAMTGERTLAEGLLIAHLASLILTAVEVVSPRGIDNLSVPVGAWCILAVITHHTPEGLAIESALPTLIAIAAVARTLRSRKIAGVGERGVGAERGRP